MKNVKAFDAKGREVGVGNRIRILSVQMELFDCLESSEVEDIRSMIGQAFRVEDIGAAGLVTVSKSFNRGDDRFESHRVSLLRSQFEIVA